MKLKKRQAKSNISDAVSRSLPWPLLFGAKYLQVNFLETLLGTLLALTAQIAFIASFLLPLKIVMLMASDGTPRFLRLLPISMEKDQLIIMLATFSIAAYIFYQFANKIIDKVTTRGAAKLESRNRKLVLFEGQHDLIRKSYRNYVEIAGNICFCLLAALPLFFLYPEVFYVVLAVLLTTTLVIITLWISIPGNREAILSSMPATLNTSSTAGFFFIFATIILDYAFFTLPNSILTILLSMILGRQILNQAQQAANKFLFLNRNQQRLTALLFHNQALSNPAPKNHQIYQFLQPEHEVQVQLKEFLRELDDTMDNREGLKWIDSGLNNIFFFTTRSKVTNASFLVKVFNKNKTQEARHEETLLSSTPSELPSPPLIETTVISGFHIHVLDITGLNFTQPAPEHEKSFRLSLAEVKVPPSLWSSYRRSKKLIWDRINQDTLKHLKLALPDQDAVAQFEDNLPLIRKTVKLLPIKISLPKNQQNFLIGNSNQNQVVCAHWGKWCIEPIGHGWNKVLGLSSENDKSAEAIGLAINLFKIENSLEKQCFNNALSLMSDTNELLKKTTDLSIVQE
ncbi:hypothetical protein [Marinobacter pelagius]|uniref:Uncharacterized protein n=1 Tax=Marinobacter pelagius TaxID=379482 RepID=A0A1I4U087_9GAMM|nr:hypothetical protein [Marinobacter pelagius]SFM82143.1 hypothetical protein SAMN04487961_1370 [Marinobacter pelagius]